MIERLTSLTTYAAYQTSVALGIALLPLAVVARQAGVTLPIHRLIRKTESAYEATR